MPTKPMQAVIDALEFLNYGTEITEDEQKTLQAMTKLLDNQEE